MKEKTKMNRLVKSAVCLMTFVVLISSPANAGLIYWSNSSGAGSFFDWSGGGSDKGLFGSPTLVGGNTFLFIPSNFRAQSSNGTAAMKSDRLEVNLTAHSGNVITGIQITEYGDYGILTTGKVSVSGTMFVTNLDAFIVRSDSFDSTPVSPITSGQGSWTAQLGITDLDWTHLKIVLNNNLMAISSAGSTSFIEKKIVGGAVVIELLGEGPNIPEPATICLLAFGSLIFARKQ